MPWLEIALNANSHEGLDGGQCVGQEEKLAVAGVEYLASGVGVWGSGGGRAVGPYGLHRLPAFYPVYLTHNITYQTNNPSEAVPACSPFGYQLRAAGCLICSNYHAASLVG